LLRIKPVKGQAGELIRAFVGEYRQLVAETQAILDGLARPGDVPCHLDLESLIPLRRIIYSLRDSSSFIGFSRLAAIARVLAEILHAHDAPMATRVLTAAQGRLLAKGFQLAGQMVEGIEAQQQEPSMEAELAGFAKDVENLGLSWEVKPLVALASDASVEGAGALPGMSDDEKVERLLAEEDVPVSSGPVESVADVTPAAAVSDMTRIFVQDAEEILDHAEQNLLQLEAEPQRLHELLRQFHTLKGNSGLMGYSQMQRISHGLEDVLQHARDRQAALGPDTVGLFLKAVDVLRRCLAALGKSGVCVVPDYEDWLHRVEAWADVSMVASQSSPGTETPPVTAEASSRAKSPESSAPAEPAAVAREGIRVSVDRLDQLSDLTGELIVATAMAGHLSECRQGMDGERFERAFRQLELLTSEMQHLSMTMRMVPVERAFRRLHRLVRDLSEKTGKPIELQLVGSETEADRRVIELITDPLIHMVRNAADHGIESVEERRRLDKPETGTIRIEALQRSGEVWIHVSDDGRGLQRGKILEHARARGLIRDGAEPQDGEVFNLIFEPGFSTAETVTEVSGRGVGLDVVRQNVERLRGRVTVQSVEGVSTTVTLRIPLTLAVVNSMIARVGAELFAVPIHTIREVVQPAPAEIRGKASQGATLYLHGERIPLFQLADLLTIHGATEGAGEGMVMVIEDGERRLALGMDEMIGQQRVVVKNLGESLGRITGVSGASVFADGQVHLILDVPGLIRIAQERTR
jgi:two-component system, chemotaxis family, sensor kinase CheA